MEVSIRIQDNAGAWHELDAKDVEIVMTKQFADLEDPSSINAAYTLDAKLPYTDTNNRILKDLYRIDYVYGGGNEFNQKEKHPCIVSHGQDIIYRGTMTIDGAQINEADARNNYYSITIYDEMYDLFTKLDYTISEPAESFDGVTDKNINIGSMNVMLTSQLVASSFENAAMATDNMHYTNGNCDYYLNPITTEMEASETVGFLPTYKEQSADEEKTVLLNANGDDQLTPQYGVVEWTTLAPNCPAKKYCEAALNTWKTYDCKPYLYYSAYLDFLFAEIYRSTGYKVNRNTNFFHPTNPYWSKLIRTCKYIKGGEESNTAWNTISTVTLTPKDFYTNKMVEKTSGDFTINDTDSNSISTFDPTTLDPKKKYKLRFTANIMPAFVMRSSSYARYESIKVKLHEKNYALAQFNYRVYSNGGVLVKTYADSLNLIPDDMNTWPSGKCLLFPKHRYYIRDVGGFAAHAESFVTVPAEDWDCYWWNGNDRTLHCSNGTDMQYVDNMTTLEPSGKRYVLEHDISTTDITNWRNTYSQPMTLGFDFTSHFSKTNKDWYYSSDPLSILGMRWLVRNVTIELQVYDKPKVDYMTLLGDDFNILEAITEFAKTFNLVVDVNYANKTINFNQRGEFYTDYRNTQQGIVIDDWSSNVNLKENLEHTAVISDYKAIKYTYEDRDTANNVYSKETANMNASTVIRDLGLPVNSEEENYLEGLYNSYVGRVDTYNYYDFLYANTFSKRDMSHSIPLYIDKSPYGEALDDVAGQLLFRHKDGIPYSQITQGGNLNPILIVEDSEWEINNEEYYIPCGFQNLNYFNFGKCAYAAPSFDIVSDDGNYCSEWANKVGNEQIGTSLGLYEVWHARWNNLIYGIQGSNQTNKKVTAYFHVPLDQYAAWNFSHLIRIDNNIYIVLSIDEYSFNNGVMKATLIQITNPYAIGQIDTEFATDYLYVMPYLRRLVNTSGGTSTTKYKVWSSKPLTYTMETANFPTWLTSAVGGPFNDVIVNKGYCKELGITYATDNSTYPAIQGPNYDWVSFDSTDGTWSADYGKEYGYCTNYPQGTSLLPSMSVTPQLTYTANENGLMVTQLIFDVVSSFYLTDVTTTNFIFNKTNWSPMGRTGNTYKVSVIGYTVAGQAGVQQTVTFKNSIGQTCTATLERLNAEYNHRETIEGENGDTDIQRWDYKTINDPLQSTYRFTVRTNYDFTIRKWAGQGTMWDNGIQEYCSDPTIKDVILRDMSDPQNPVDYDGESQPFVGQANNTYTLEWHYYRRLGINNTKYDGYFDIQCIDGHSVPAYKKKVNVFCNVQNDQP